MTLSIVKNHDKVWNETFRPHTYRLLPSRELSLANLGKVLFVALGVIANAVEILVNAIRYDLLGRVTPYKQIEKRFLDEINGITKPELPTEEITTEKIQSAWKKSQLSPEEIKEEYRTTREDNLNATNGEFLRYVDNILKVAGLFGKTEKIKKIKEEFHLDKEAQINLVDKLSTEIPLMTSIRDVDAAVNQLKESYLNPLARLEKRLIEEFGELFPKIDDITKPFKTSRQLQTIDGTYFGNTEESAKNAIAIDLNRSRFIFNGEVKKGDTSEARRKIAEEIIDTFMTSISPSTTGIREARNSVKKALRALQELEKKHGMDPITTARKQGLVRILEKLPTSSKEQKVIDMLHMFNQCGILTPSGYVSSLFRMQGFQWDDTGNRIKNNPALKKWFRETDTLTFEAKVNKGQQILKLSQIGLVTNRSGTKAHQVAIFTVTYDFKAGTTDLRVQNYGELPKELQLDPIKREVEEEVPFKEEPIFVESEVLPISPFQSLDETALTQEELEETLEAYRPTEQLSFFETFPPSDEFFRVEV